VSPVVDPDSHESVNESTLMDLNLEEIYRGTKNFYVSVIRALIRFLGGWSSLILEPGRPSMEVHIATDKLVILSFFTRCNFSIFGHEIV